MELERSLTSVRSRTQDMHKALAGKAKARNVLGSIAGGPPIFLEGRTMAEQPPGEILDALRLKVPQQFMAVEEAMRK